MTAELSSMPVLRFATASLKLLSELVEVKLFNTAGIDLRKVEKIADKCFHPLRAFGYIFHEEQRIAVNTFP